ncbi:MAG: polymerase [Mesorhizobium sp.]|uniref:O-antigen ligase family protein n=1 Tax=Mesorhizobium sp. TaxID=1871066 RepID=UPI00120F7682|nr:polymerase [Mesorhizobium sp.]TIP71730.1 MAG: polymerase [Mesorhizobium sp.]TIQ14630.1 MAG: polymerase [Mesorhizobium sp.]TIR52225.1 MAG: polymerase [Mesorhizobium sp.]TJV97111.1 MAG: polymerase [Mesorhizobium sp.]
MIRNALLAGGISMGYAVQISVPGLPVGYTELLLSLWIMLSIGRVVAGGRLEATPALFRLATFWLIMALAQGIGALVGLLTTTVLDLSGPIHDTMAYMLLASVTCLAAAEPDAGRQMRRTAWWAIGIVDGCFLFQLALGWGWIHQSGVNPWFWDRFTGWSENPNQLALYCALFGPLALHLATTTSNPWGRLFGFSSLVLTVYVGRLTRSDAYLLTSVLTCLIFLGLRIRTWLTTGDKASVSRQVAVLLMVGFLPLSMSMTPYVLRDLSSVENFAKSLSKGRGGEETVQTAELRVKLWGNAVYKGVTSASLGLGPGPHVDRPSVYYRQFLPEPFEAHNTILDLYTQGGLIALLALFWIVGSAAMSAWRAKLDALFALVVSIMIYGFPHLIIRHPIVWFGLTLCLVAGTRRAVSGTSRKISRDLG